MGESDKGSHTYGGKRTERTEPMYHIGGTSYVYLIYGMYSCMNIAAMTEGIPQAVLLRSVVPADEVSTMSRLLSARVIPMARHIFPGPSARCFFSEEGHSGSAERGTAGSGRVSPQAGLYP